MKLCVLTILAFLSLPIMAQKQVSVIDDDSRQPVANAIIADSIEEIAQTSTQGIAVVPRRKGKIIFVHKNYDRLTLDYDSIPAVVKMHRREYMLDEVEVLAKKGMTIHFDLGLNKVDMAEAKYKASGGNPMSGLSDLLFNRKERKRRKHREKLKKILDRL